MSRFARTLTDSPARSLDQLCETAVASTGPYASDDTALLLARTADVMSHGTGRD